MEPLKTFCVSLCITLIVFVSSYALSERSAYSMDKQAPQPTGNDLNVVQVDALDRVFSDLAPEPEKYKQPISVPRGGKTAFQFAVTSAKGGSCEISVSSLARADGVAMAGAVKLHEILPVHVEANSAGTNDTRVGKKPPDSWLPFLVRLAPFDVAEVLVEANHVQLAGNATNAILVDVHVSPDAQPGEYTGSVKCETAGGSAEAPFSLLVHKTVVPEKPRLKSMHRLSSEPRNLTSGEPPELWSEEYWRLLENCARQLRESGNRVLTVPLIGDKQPLIQTIREADGAYTFDYARFDRWFEMALKLGFDYLMGTSIGGCHRTYPLNVFVVDRGTGQEEQIFSRSSDVDAWLEFLPVFFRSFSAHLGERGWTKSYFQELQNEPHLSEPYARLSDLARKYLPGVKTIDEIHAYRQDPWEYTDLVDVYILALELIHRNKDLADKRRADGLDVWFYNYAGPTPPFPNRHLDRSLVDSRLYPWLAYLVKAEGYSFWGGNLYRGADPYATSIGPMPGGSQNPGHPPGDAWMLYPDPEGIRPSMRTLAFREGLLDHALLIMLAERDSAEADRIMSQIAVSAVEYEKEPQPYHAARKALLIALDGYESAEAAQ